MSSLRPSPQLSWHYPCHCTVSQELLLGQMGGFQSTCRMSAGWFWARLSLGLGLGVGSQTPGPQERPAHSNFLLFGASSAQFPPLLLGEAFHLVQSGWRLGSHHNAHSSMVLRFCFQESTVGCWPNKGVEITATPSLSQHALWVNSATLTVTPWTWLLFSLLRRK